MYTWMMKTICCKSRTGRQQALRHIKKEFRRYGTLLNEAKCIMATNSDHKPEAIDLDGEAHPDGHTT